MLPSMGTRMPYNLPLNWPPHQPGDDTWNMIGYYQSTTSSLGNSRLNVYGELVGDIIPEKECISYVVLGTDSQTEWFKTSQKIS